MKINKKFGFSDFPFYLYIINNIDDTQNKNKKQTELKQLVP
jgi:hypothetical protein